MGNKVQIERNTKKTQVVIHTTKPGVMIGHGREEIEKLKNKEIEYEIRFCDRRNTGYELYLLALAMGKKVIFTSDMYLSKEVIQKILEKKKHKIYLK